MKNIRKIIRQLIRFTYNNYITAFFIAIILFVGIITFIKYITQDHETVYAEVKISQGLWWVNTAKPSVWVVNSIHKGDIEKDLLGNSIAEIIEVRYYPLRDTDLYDMYVKLKMKVDYNTTNGKYTFKRNTLASGSPIDLDFSTFQISGTVIKISPKPFKNNLVEKEIWLTKKFVYPNEYESIQEGDVYFDGTENIFEIIDLELTDTYSTYSEQGNNYPVETQYPKNVLIKAKIKVQEMAGTNIFAVEKIVKIGKPLDISTHIFSFGGYIVSRINEIK